MLVDRKNVFELNIIIIFDECFIIFVATLIHSFLFSVNSVTFAILSCHIK